MNEDHNPYTFDGEPMTLQEIAAIEGVSHQRITQILASALRKVAKALDERKIKLEDLL
jgi:DNA-directed RNA polymerase sigma subunit (sigma70/sigma32)